MPFTTAAFTETTQNATLLPVAAAADQHLTVSGDDLTVPVLDKLLMSYALSANLREARIESPSLRRVWLEDLAEFLNSANLSSAQAVDEGGAATYTINHPVKVNDYRKRVIPLAMGEKLNFLADNNNNSEVTTGLIWLCDESPIPTPEQPEFADAEIRTLKATAAVTLTANAWTIGTLTFGQTLPVGTYAVVGMKAKSATLIAARLVFVGGAWRPATIGVNAYGDKQPEIFRKGELGVWGRFVDDQPPQVEYFATGADTAEEVWLDLIHVSPERAALAAV